MFDVPLGYLRVSASLSLVDGGMQCNNREVALKSLDARYGLA